MSDVALVALISGSATILVSLFGLIGTVFGPSLVERTRRKAAEKERQVELKLQREALRTERAQELSEAIVQAIGSENWEGYAASDAAVIRFVATLGPGEGEVARFVRNIEVRGNRQSPFDRKDRALQDMARLFDWLRGDITIDELVPAKSRPDIVVTQSEGEG